MAILQNTIENGPGATQRHYGKFRGLVTNNQDPKNLARIKVKVPSVLQEVESGWALPSLPYSGKGSGFFRVPPPGAGVWVEFEAGDAGHPIWTGCFWGDGQLPADQDGNQATPDYSILRSEAGLMVVLNDAGPTISISDGSGANLVNIAVSEGQITINATAKVVVNAARIELIDGAPHPLVFGDNLLVYLNELVGFFNLHTHPGELAAAVLPVTPALAVPQFVPPSPTLLSLRVKTG